MSLYKKSATRPTKAMGSTFLKNDLNYSFLPSKTTLSRAFWTYRGTGIYAGSGLGLA